MEEALHAYAGAEEDGLAASRRAHFAGMFAHRNKHGASLRRMCSTFDEDGIEHVAATQSTASQQTLESWTEVVQTGTTDDIDALMASLAKTSLESAHIVVEAPDDAELASDMDAKALDRSIAHHGAIIITKYEHSEPVGGKRKQPTAIYGYAIPTSQLKPVPTPSVRSPITTDHGSTVHPPPSPRHVEQVPGQGKK
jgi:hypothetical protein